MGAGLWIYKNSHHSHQLMLGISYSIWVRIVITSFLMLSAERMEENMESEYFIAHYGVAHLQTSQLGGMMAVGGTIPYSQHQLIGVRAILYKKYSKTCV